MGREGARLLRVSLVGYRLEQPASVLSYANRRRSRSLGRWRPGPRSSCWTSPSPHEPRESEELTGLIGKLRDDWGFTIVMIEHDMGVVRDVSDHRVLDHGETIGRAATKKCPPIPT